ncbi:MAG: dipeptidase [Lachnospiraceae bacterium]|nr:dipeptidase [Lachnospiraceae bacterium]
MKVADMHCDTISEILYRKKGEREGVEHLRKNNLHIDLEKMKQGDYLLQNFALFVYLKHRENPFEWCMELADTFYVEMEANKDLIAPIRCYQDILDNQAAGKMSAMLTIEEGGVCKGNPAFLRNFYRLGVRMMTLTWNFPNEIGYPNAVTPSGERAPYGVPNTECGLTPLGIEFVQEMERLGMIIDVSHLSDAGFYDVLKYTKKPFVASHSNARACCGHIRNMTDDMIRKLAERGGVMGMNFEPSFLRTYAEGEKPHARISEVVDNICHIANIAGTECIGLGSDFDGIDTHEELYDASCLPKLEDALWKAGFGQQEIENIFYKNVLRVYKEVLK